MPASLYELRVLGRAEVLSAGVPIRFRSAKVVELLAFLAAHPGQQASRASAADALYAESLRSRENLRQTLLYLSKSAPELLNIGPDRLTLRALDSDLARFLAGDLEAYAGPFLPRCDADWANAIRADLEQQYVSGNIAAGNDALTSDPERAARLAKRAIQVDPYLEQPRRLRWHALELLGETAVAAAERAQYAAFIREEVGIELGTAPPPAAPSLTRSERLLRAVALAPEAYEHGQLVAVAESLTAGIAELESNHPYVALGWIALARVLFEMGDTEGAAEAIENGKKLKLTQEQELELSVTEARVHARMGHHDASIREARRAASSRLAETAAEGHRLLSYVAWAKADYRFSLQEADKALSFANRCGAGKLQVRAYRSKASAYFRLGQIPEAAVSLQEGIDIAQMIGRLDLESELCSDLGRLYEATGDDAMARELFVRTMSALEKTDFRVSFAQSVTYLGDWELRSGNFEESRRLHGIGVAVRRMMGDLVGLATSYRGLGNAQLRLEDYAGAVESLRTALRLFRRFGEAGSMGSARVPLARALFAAGDTINALKQAQQAQTDLADLSEDDILIRYNDASLLSKEVTKLVEQISL